MKKTKKSRSSLSIKKYKSEDKVEKLSDFLKYAPAKPMLEMKAVKAKKKIKKRTDDHKEEETEVLDKLELVISLENKSVCVTEPAEPIDSPEAPSEEKKIGKQPIPSMKRPTRKKATRIILLQH